MNLVMSKVVGVVIRKAEILFNIYQVLTKFVLTYSNQNKT